VSAGQTVQADATGLSPVTSFDVAAESADWAKLGAGTTTTDTAAGTAAADSGLPVALLAGLVGLVVLLLAGILVVTRQRRRRPLLAPSGLASAMPFAPSKRRADCRPRCRPPRQPPALRRREPRPASPPRTPSARGPDGVAEP